jgi:hypothetical protein
MNLSDDFGGEGELQPTSTGLPTSAEGVDFGFIGLIVGICLGSLVFSIIFLTCCFKFSRQNQPNVSGEEATPQEIELARKLPIRNDSLAKDQDAVDDDSETFSELTLHSVKLKEDD